MRKELPIGISDYRKAKEEGYYVVDKTKLIEEFLRSKSGVTLITRPRRFGKTLNMSMLYEFLDITKDSKDIFKDTYIMQSEYASYMNQYPTIFLSFASAKGVQYDISEQVKYQIREEYRRYRFIFQNLTDEFDIDDYHRVLKGLKQIDDGNLKNIKQSLVFLMDQLYAYYGKRVMVIIDEYDTPFIQAKMNGCYDEIRSGLSEMLHKA